ncbi:MAG: RHS repeat-associated core domain-containing protein [Pseudomonadota bacterium]
MFGAPTPINHLGSPALATTTGGAVDWREDYTPYGEERQNPAANDNDENFTGHIRDDATGLLYVQARYMDPLIGRFLSGDPVQFSERAPQMFNRYSYTLNEPLNAIDPDGLTRFRATQPIVMAAAPLAPKQKLLDAAIKMLSAVNGLFCEPRKSAADFRLRRFVFCLFGGALTAASSRRRR